MSSRNRTQAPAAHDRYITPPVLVRMAFDQLTERHPEVILNTKHFLEPGCGPGSFCRAASIYCSQLVGLPVGVEKYPGCKSVVPLKRIRTDFLTYKTPQTFDLISTNPPFTYAAAFITKALQLLTDDGVLFFLMRASMLGSKKRRVLWRTINLIEVTFIRPRPSFTEGGSDSDEYAFFLIDKRDPATAPETVLTWLDWRA